MIKRSAALFPWVLSPLRHPAPLHFAPLHPGACAAAASAIASRSYCEDMKVFLTRNGEAVPCSLGELEWLAQAPRGAYTTARTVGGTSIFKLSPHITRMANSARLMMEADQQPLLPALTDPEQLRPEFIRCCRATIEGFHQQHGSSLASEPGPLELKLTVLLTWSRGGQQHDIWWHATPLGARPQPPIKVQVRGAPRSNAKAKDSEWVRGRQALEQSKPKDANEVVLMAPDGGLMEGLTSNFFALQHGKLVTAEEGVLSGTVRELVLQVAEELGVPVELRAPSISELGSFEAAFISSTSRLLLPVHELDAPDLQPPARRVLPPSELAQRLEAAVAAEIAACSEPVA